MNLHNALPLRLCIFLFVSRTYEVSFSTSYFLINLSNISDVFKVHLNLAISRNPLQKIFPRIWKYNLVLLVNEKNLLFSGIVNSSQKQPPRGVFKLLCNFIEIALRHGCSPVNCLHIFRTTFLKNTSGCLLLSFLHLLQFS